MEYSEGLLSDLEGLLKEYSPSGSEESILEYVKAAIVDCVDEVQIDAIGNLVAHKKASKEGGKKVMISAHADEIGFLIHYIDDNGFLYFREIGGIDTNLLPGLRFDIITPNGIVKGVIATLPIHLQDREAKPKDLNSSDLCIDIGAKDKKSALERVSIGDYATFEYSFVKSGTIVYSKSLDNKVGIAALMGIIKGLNNKDLNDDIFFVASVQEELGARGAKSATFNIQPDCGIAIDVTHATDYPGLPQTKFGDIRLGNGAVLAKGPNINKKLFGTLSEIAKDNNIDLQVEALSGATGTDANPMQIEGGGVKTALVSIPCRYMHTPNEAVDIRDVQNTIDLIYNSLIFKSF